MVLALVSAKERTRTKFALKSILNKVSLYETVQEMAAQVELLEQQEAATSNGPEFTSNVMIRLIQCVKQLERTFQNLDSLMSHPSRYLPCKHRFNLNRDIFHQPEVGYFRMLAAGGCVLDIITAILCLLNSEDLSSLHESVPSHVPDALRYNLLSSIYSLLSNWSANMEGLKFMASNTEQLQSLITVMLTDNGKSSAMDESANGQLIIYRLYTLLYLDTLMAEQLDQYSAADTNEHDIFGGVDQSSAFKNRRQLENETILSTIQSLFGLTFTSHGKQAVIQVLTMDSNLDGVVRLCNHTDMQGQKDMKKSGIRGYANELVLLCVRNCEQLDFITKYSKVRLCFGLWTDFHGCFLIIMYVNPVVSREG